MSASESPDNILYVKSINSEWKLDAEAATQPFRERWESLAEIQSTGSAWSYLSNLTCKYNLDCQSPEVLKVIEAQSPWKIILSNSKKQLAVLQDSHVEIRSAENDFTEVLFRWVMPTRDEFPQWRNLAWSPCDSLIACSDSRGNVFLYSINGDQLSHVVQPKNQGCDLGNAVCCLTFKEKRSLEQQADDGQHWLHELLVVTYQGLLHTFIISQEGDYLSLNTFNFDGGYPNGIVDAVFVATCDMLVVGGGGQSWSQGATTGGSDRDEMSKRGMSVWRVLSGHPYYKLASGCNAESTVGLKKFSSRWGWPWSGQQKGDKVVKLAVSPDHKTLVSVHTCEDVCMWSLPSLRLVKKFPLLDQPCRDYIDLGVLENPKKMKEYKNLLNAYHVVALAWWSNEDIIISRGTGSLTVSNVNNLTNRLGSSPEFFHSEMNLMRYSDGCFYILECQKKQGPLKRGEMEDLKTNDSESEEECSKDANGNLITRLLRHGLYYVTDFETFRPTKKKSRLVRRIYRMICLRSTTPEELYSNMLDGEDYEEALSLARKYNLDCDLTYQKQWKKLPVTVSSIQDYLRKITKRSWVLHECMETVPDDLHAMEELLRYGLRGTDLEAVVAAGRDDDDARFVFCESFCDYKPLEGGDDDDDDDDENRMKDEKRRKEFLKQINFKNLTFNQKELCRTRLKLLQYMDRLETYKDILKRRDSSHEKYDKAFFKRFRKENIVQLAVECARLLDTSALESLFCYHGNEVLPHRLSIIWNIPETTMPGQFAHLLPKIWMKDEERVIDDWRVSRWRDQYDWSEQFCSTQNLISVIDSGEFLYEENPDLLELRGRSLNDEQMTSWFRRRSLEIEKMSGQVDCACELLSIGIKNNVQDLEVLHEDFALMERLVYECQAPPTFTFHSLSKMSQMERIQRMMAKTTREMFIRNMKRWIVPYLKQQDAKSKGSYYLLLKNYLVGMAEEDLTNVEQVIKDCKHDKLDPIISDVHQLYSMSACCIYSHAGFDQLFMIRSIIQNLPDLDDTTEESRLKMSMSKHLLGAETLKRNGIGQTLSQIRDIQKSETETTQILTRLSRISAKKTPPMSQSELELLLSDMCLLQENVFTNISRTKTHEIFVGALLCSGNMSHINLGGKVMNSSLDPSSHAPQRQMTRASVTSSIKDSLKSLTRSTPPPSFSTINPSIPSEFVECVINRSKCTELVLQAATEYFNSSADFLHENMKLAKSCLELMPERPPELQDELNLIEALAMLKLHGISEFPAHLRMAEDRLKYIKEVLKKRSMTYKNYSKLLEFGKLLKVGKGDDRLLQGQIFDLIAQHALEAKDYNICLDSCRKLMSLNYEDGWKVCRCLAEDEGFDDDPSKYELFDFTLLHSPDSNVDEILVSFSKFQVKALCRTVSSDMTSVDPTTLTTHSRSGGNHAKSIEKVLIGQTKQVFSLTKVVFDHIGDTQWWTGVVSHAASGIKRLTVLEAKNKRRRRKNARKSIGDRLAKQTCHPFFKSRDNSMTGFHGDDLEVADVYMSDEAVNPVVSINEQLLRIYLINRAGDDDDDDENRESRELMTQVLLMLAENVLPGDMSLGMLYLLALPDALSFEKCFNRLPKMPLSYQLAVYFYALKISLSMKASGAILPTDLPEISPKSLVCHVEELAGELDSEQERLYERMHHYQACLLDHQESESLRNMDRGIDTTRFNSDDLYKRETILGMALTLDDGLLRSALNLASKYDLPARDVYMAHLGYLFDDSSDLTAKQIDGRIKEWNMLEVLNENPTWFAQTMREQIFPLIEGGDLDCLLVYYSYLSPREQINEDDDVVRSSLRGDGQFRDEINKGIRPLEHVKMIKKFRNVALGVNYKNLFSGKCNIEDVLVPIIDASNVATLAKYSRNYVDKKGRTIDSCFVHGCHASKVFNVPVFGGETDWGEKFKSCLESIKMMSPKALNEFIDENLFGPRAVRMIPVEGRKQVLKLVMKHSKQQLSSARKNSQHDASSDWEEFVQILQKDLDHLNKMSSKMISRLSTSDDVVWQNYAIEFDLTQSRAQEVKHLLKKMILSLESVEFVEEFNKNLSTHEFLLQDLYSEVLQELSSTSNPLDKVKKVLAEVSKGSSQVNLKELCTCLKNFVACSNIDAHSKLQILSVIKENSPVDDNKEDILYSQTCAVLSMLDCQDVQVTHERISQEKERILIFNDLLESLTSVGQLSELNHLLKIWPNFENSVGNLRLKLLKKLIVSSVDDEERLKRVMPIVLESIEEGHLNEEEIEQLYDIIASNDLLEACKMLILTSSEVLNDKALTSLQSMSSDMKDDSLFLLLLKHQFLPRCTNLPFYHNLLDFVLTYKTDPELRTDEKTTGEMVRSALEVMSSSGQQAAAGSVYMSWKSVHRGLRTFDAAINFVDKFLSK